MSTRLLKIPENSEGECTVLARARGRQTPQTRGGYIVSTVEQFVGLLLSALLLGVVVTKASIPSAKLVFSKARRARMHTTS